MFGELFTFLTTMSIPMLRFEFHVPNKLTKKCSWHCCRCEDEGITATPVLSPLVLHVLVVSMVLCKFLNGFQYRYYEAFLKFRAPHVQDQDAGSDGTGRRSMHKSTLESRIGSIDK